MIFFPKHAQKENIAIRFGKPIPTVDHKTHCHVRTWRAQLSSNTHHTPQLGNLCEKWNQDPVLATPRATRERSQPARQRDARSNPTQDGQREKSSVRINFSSVPSKISATFAIDCSCRVEWPPNHDDSSGKTLCNGTTFLAQLSGSSGNSQDDVSSLSRLLLQPSVSKRSKFDICLSSPRIVHITTSIVSSKIIALAHPCHHKKKQNTRGPRTQKPSQD